MWLLDIHRVEIEYECIIWWLPFFRDVLCIASHHSDHTTSNTYVRTTA
jgi:hypothetical protein